MENILEELFIDYNSISNNTNNLSTKIDLILSTFSINNDLPIFYIGIFNDFIIHEPQFYYSNDVKTEILTNLTQLYDTDSDMFVNSFYQYIDSFFYSFSSYNSILDLYHEFDDVGLELITKTKIYHIPLITQLMEFCLNHYYRGIASIEGAFKTKDYTTQKTLGQLKNILTKNYPKLLDIDINFRNAMSHGLVEFTPDRIRYSYTEKESKKEVFKSLTYHDLEEMQNDLLDISSGALLGLFLFMTQKELVTNDFLGTMNEKTSFTFLKLFLYHENIKIASYSIDASQFSLYIDINGISDSNQLRHKLVLISKIMYITFSNYEQYFIYYTHPNSIDGMISFTKEQIQEMLPTTDISKINKIIAKNPILLIPDIQEGSQDNRSYKFHTFPEIKGYGWKIIHLKDISNDTTKRFSAKLIITQKSISKKEVEKILFLVTKRIRILENKSNPKDKIKHGKIEAEFIRISVFYQSKIRNQLKDFMDESFISLMHYYKNKSTPRLPMINQDTYHFENLKKFDIFWNKDFINADL